MTDPDLHTLAAEAPDEAPWRTGVAAGDGFIYRQAGPRPDGCDPRIGHMDTPDLARQVVEAVNGYRDRVPLADVLDALRDEGALLRWYQTHHPDKYVNLHAAGRLAGYLADRFAAPQDTDERTGSDG